MTRSNPLDIPITVREQIMVFFFPFFVPALVAAIGGAVLAAAALDDDDSPTRPRSEEEAGARHQEKAAAQRNFRLRQQQTREARELGRRHQLSLPPSFPVKAVDYPEKPIQFIREAAEQRAAELLAPLEELDHQIDSLASLQAELSSLMHSSCNRQ